MRAVVLFLAVLVVAAGCGEGEPVANAEESPLGDYLGIEGGLFGPGAQSEAAFLESEQSRQVMVAECMAAKGFEYTPEDVSALISFDSENGGLDPSSREWTEKYGFGVTTQHFSQSQVGPNLVGHEDNYGDEMEDFEDPNQEYLSSLDDQEQEAYQQALYGNMFGPGSFDETMTDEELDKQFEGDGFDIGGCVGESFEADGVGSIGGIYMEFGQEIGDMFQSMENHPLIIEAIKEIESCVTGEGLEFVDPSSAWEHWADDLDALSASMYEFDEAMIDALEEGEVFDQPMFDLPELSDDDKAKLGELQAEEIEIALATYDCGGGFNKMETIFHQVRIELEQQFVEENKEKLDEYLERSS